MSSRKGGGGKPFVADTSHSSSKFSGIPEGSSPKVDQLTDAVADVSLEGGEWEVCTRKAKNRAFGGGAGKPWPSQSSGAKVWGHPAAVQELGGVQISGGSGTVPPGNSWPTLDTGSRRPLGRGNNSRPQSAGRGFVSNSNTPSPRAIPLPLEHGWNWPTRAAASSQSSEDATGQRDTTIHLDDPTPVDDDDGKIENDDDSDEVDTDDELLTDEYDSDVSEKSHDSRKNSKWFKVFFENLDKLSLDDIHGPSRQWHCPACKGGPGAIDWYRGLQPLMTHAKTKGSKRVKLHRGFAELLDEELRRRGTSVIPAGETFGKWKGLDEMVKDRSIVWPPMVVIMNTRLEQDENDKWLGMGNQELLDSFSSYSAVKARHAYGPQGHRGMSVLIFENSAMGFLEAERNKAARLKFETRSYQEMVVNQMRQMSEDNQQLIWFKDKVAKEQRRSKALEESFEVVSEKLRKTVEENRIVRQRSKMHHEQNKEEFICNGFVHTTASISRTFHISDIHVFSPLAHPLKMDFQEQFFKDQLETIHKTRDAKEDEFEKIQQEEREKKKQSNAHVSAKGDRSRREEDFAKFVKSQDKEMEEFVSEREKLVKAYEDNKISMKQRHFKEEFQLEKDFDTALNQLMNKYSPHRLEEEGNSSDQ
ncbi:hypothetical protein RHSIM_Rhsim04G0129300 [Rhododendron simsii]|uniref:Uncharacterized protein n=1 Tax=Rhododendron simsii TaxID=118357 RepID=A0A834H558_RHOSS|nr:hypothetical protein RHSIM_Rhsim04G0129300 [Rhododendron simsii]